MKRAFAVMILLLSIFAQSVFAGSGSCSDSDKGPSNLKDVSDYLLVPGTAKDPFSTKSDACVRTEFSEKKVQEGQWLREFYCVGAMAMHKDFKCADFGFEKCVTDDTGSYCKSNKPKTAAAQITTSQKKPVADFYCGTKVMNRADAQCFPPGKICIQDRMPGQCSNDCKCILIGNKSDKEATKEVEEKVVNKVVSKETPKETPKSDASLEIKVPKQKGVSTEPVVVQEKKEVDNSPIKQTVTLRVISGIANGVKSVWAKIAGIF